MLASRVRPAHAVDGAAAIAFWDEVTATHELLGAVQVIFMDNSFHGVFRQQLAQRYGIRVEKLARVLVRKTSLCIHARRWIIERAFAWLDMNRRLSKEYDRTLRHANNCIAIVNIRRTLDFCEFKQLLGHVLFMFASCWAATLVPWS